MDIQVLVIEIAKLELSPGDVLVVKPRARLSINDCQVLQWHIEHCVPAEIQVVILREDVDLEVVRLANG